MTTPLSPAAQAVMDAAGIGNLFDEEVAQRRHIIAAALRAAADESSPDWMGLTVIHHLYALADELEGN